MANACNEWIKPYPEFPNYSQSRIGSFNIGLFGVMPNFFCVCIFLGGDTKDTCPLHYSEFYSMEEDAKDVAQKIAIVVKKDFECSMI
jgi:hypothetical protein